MSILIKGMEMPICRTCPCGEEKLYGNLCRITNEIVPWAFDRGDKCPLIEVPDVYIDISKAFMTELCNKVCTDTPVAPLHLPAEGDDGKV